MAHPYQCLMYCNRPDKTISQILVAASGSFIYAFNVASGEHLSSWASVRDTASSHQVFISAESKSGAGALQGDTEKGPLPPSKRRKISPARAAPISTESSSTEIIVDSKNDPNGWHTNPVVKLTATSNGQYIVAVTSEDKCMRVFELQDDGTLQQFSERTMPKRPCAVILSPDDSKILCADKFGDVYSLPLLGQSYELSGVKRAVDESSTKKSESTPKKFVPSATSLTVHTKRNLDALKQQQNLIRKKPEKNSLMFAHQLLLGHVSLLTDVVYASDPSSLSKRRDYILTSDRDEHIRVSRGIPQAHIIEGYCLGHTEFVSKLCLVPSRTQLLISGGGDDFLLLWEWLAGNVKQKLDLKGFVEDSGRAYAAQNGVSTPENFRQKGNEPAPDDKFKIAVRNIQILEVRGDQGEDQVEIIVTCEGVPALFLFFLNQEGEIQYRETHPTERNVIDVVVLQDQSSIIYSMDTVHKPFSTTEEDDSSAASISLLDAIHFLHGSQRWEEDLNFDGKLLSAMEECATARPLAPQKQLAKGRSLKELLYGLESLRKREMGNDAEPEEAAEIAE